MVAVLHKFRCSKDVILYPQVTNILKCAIVIVHGDEKIALWQNIVENSVHHRLSMHARL